VSGETSCIKLQAKLDKGLSEVRVLTLNKVV